MSEPDKSPKPSMRNMEGWLTKRGHVFKTWKKRWFVLSGLTLKYFIKQGGSLRGTIPLDRCRVAKASRLIPRKWTFEIQTPAKVFYIQCADALDLQRWVQAITSNIRVSELGLEKIFNKITAVESTPHQIKLFTGTWNMAEQDCPSNIREFVAPGMDIYAIGVQECMDLEGLRRGVKVAIGTDYIEMHSHIGKIGFGYHGYIALIVYVKQWLVMAGVCDCSRVVRKSVAMGVNLVVTRATNKGAVLISLPLRLPGPDGRLGPPVMLNFVTCHLASDKSGVSKLDLRNRNAMSMLEHLQLDVPPELLQSSILPQRQPSVSLDSSKAASLLGFSGGASDNQPPARRASAATPSTQAQAAVQAPKTHGTSTSDKQSGTAAPAPAPAAAPAKSAATADSKRDASEPAPKPQRRKSGRRSNPLSAQVESWVEPVSPTKQQDSPPKPAAKALARRASERASRVAQMARKARGSITGMIQSAKGGLPTPIVEGGDLDSSDSDEVGSPTPRSRTSSVSSVIERSANALREAVGADTPPERQAKGKRQSTGRRFMRRASMTAAAALQTVADVMQKDTFAEVQPAGGKVEEDGQAPAATKKKRKGKEKRNQDKDKNSSSDQSDMSEYETTSGEDVTSEDSGFDDSDAEILSDDGSTASFVSEKEDDDSSSEGIDSMATAQEETTSRPVSLPSASRSAPLASLSEGVGVDDDEDGWADSEAEPRRAVGGSGSGSSRSIGVGSGEKLSAGELAAKRLAEAAARTELRRVSQGLPAVNLAALNAGLAAKSPTSASPLPAPRIKRSRRKSSIAGPGMMAAAAGAGKGPRKRRQSMRVVVHGTGTAIPKPAAAALPTLASVDDSEAEPEASGQSLLEGSPERSCVFVMGDLNYRVELSPLDAVKFIAKASNDSKTKGDDAWLRMLMFDQLGLSMRQGLAFPGFEEAGTIAFPPTYRRRKSKTVIVHDYGSEEQLCQGYTLSVKKKKKGAAYDPEKEHRQARTPSWTDRVLVRKPIGWKNFPLTTMEYKSVDQVRYSDHAPVRAIMKIQIKGHGSVVPPVSRLGRGALRSPTKIAHGSQKYRTASVSGLVMMSTLSRRLKFSLNLPSPPKESGFAATSTGGLAFVSELKEDNGHMVLPAGVGGPPPLPEPSAPTIPFANVPLPPPWPPLPGGAPGTMKPPPRRVPLPPPPFHLPAAPQAPDPDSEEDEDHVVLPATWRPTPQLADTTTLASLLPAKPPGSEMPLPAPVPPTPPPAHLLPASKQSPVAAKEEEKAPASQLSEQRAWARRMTAAAVQEGDLAGLAREEEQARVHSVGRNSTTPGTAGRASVYGDMLSAAMPAGGTRRGTRMSTGMALAAVMLPPPPETEEDDQSADRGEALPSPPPPPPPLPTHDSEAVSAVEPAALG